MDATPPPGWTLQENALVRTFERADFVEALAFLLAAAKPAEKANHHPDVDLRYNKLHFRLSTHSAGHRVTAKDVALAEEINGLDEAHIRSITEDLRRRLGA
jgi:4a-hydroxytetrahydrobiopterin dehydratase